MLISIKYFRQHRRTTDAIVSNITIRVENENSLIKVNEININISAMWEFINFYHALIFKGEVGLSQNRCMIFLFIQILLLFSIDFLNFIPSFFLFPSKGRRFKRKLILSIREKHLPMKREREKFSPVILSMIRVLSILSVLMPSHSC